MTLIPMVRRNRAAFLVSAGFLLLAACNPFGGGGDSGAGLSRTESIIATATARGPVPTPTPTVPPVPTATPLPTPTPTPSPLVGRALAEALVWSEVSGCAEQLAQTPGQVAGEAAAAAVAPEVNVVFNSAYDATNLRWVVGVVTSDDLLSFGQWTVADQASPSVTPRDATAARIAAGGTRCALPSALQDDVPTPPLFLAIAIDPLVPNEELAAIQVWTTVYGCFEDFPAFENFKARPGVGGNWIVEGKAPTTPYGLWEVNATTGVITPRDDLARQVDAARREESCAPSAKKKPAAVTAEEASIRAWVAAYDCFTPHPDFLTFTTRQDDPRQWIVEGRGTVDTEVDVEVQTESGTETFTETRTQTVFYGLWLVDTETGEVSGLDNLAITQSQNFCFTQLP